MKAATLVALGVALASAAALADTFYHYRDQATGRDVFVNRLEQVPRKYRRQTEIVFESGAIANQDEVKQTAPEIPADEGLADQLIKEIAPGAPPASGASLAARSGTGSNLLRRAPALAAAVVDAKLGKAGAPALTDVEYARLSRFLMAAVYAGLVASLCAFVVWVVLIVCAFRDKHPAWGAFMIVVVPLAYLYLLLHFAKLRPWHKILAALGLLSPALVALWAAWEFHGWFRLVVAARGGSL